MKPVIQQKITGCAIASSAAIADITHEKAKTIVNSMGIYATDTDLWSETGHIRKLLAKLGISAGSEEIAFTDWASLPNCALLSTKWRIENAKPYWHSVVFVREGGQNMYWSQTSRSNQTSE